ncbi:hypothetical protein DB88DRAFT_539642 [Papiliotrema laurentii]|uniref:Uncharacterized protein n=1 Tax=Papiliotrema laurentii TaxID=5418 RepID=A0AAD9FRG4_PAPLA|nr:hypothetical protein DB88DRAFT_539642 [Papiliotrema laurentii]
MKWILATSLLTAVAALRIETPPSLVTCQPAAIAFADGQPPYFVAVLPAGQVSATPLKQFPETNSSPLTWTVDLPANTNITLRVTDGTGTPAYSSSAVIQPGTDTACVGSGGNSTSASGGGGASSGSPSATTSGGASGSASATSSATSAASSAAQSTGAAVLGKQAGGPIFGFLGLVVAGLGAVL